MWGISRVAQAGLAGLLMLAAVPFPAALGQDDVASPACPAPDVPVTSDDASVHARSVACATWWGLVHESGPEFFDGFISRGELSHVVADLLVRAGVALRTPEQDVFADDNGHPEETSLAMLASVGIVHGTGLGGVAPDTSASRAHLAALAARTLELLEQEALPGGHTTFTDIDDSPHRTAIQRAAIAGLVRGVSSERFVPDVAATRGQTATVLVRILDRLVERGVLDPPATDGPFDLRVVPDKVSDSIPGQMIVLLAAVARDDEPTAGAMTVTASAPTGQVTVADEAVEPGGVVEVTYVPEAVQSDTQPQQLLPPEGTLSVEARVPVTVVASRGMDRHRIVVPVRVNPGEDSRRARAEELLAYWVGWLEAEHPDLGISTETAWTPTTTQPHILVVEHYLFFSDDWELGMTWHVMIPPYDWTEIYLRPRDALAPTLAFRLPSVSDPEALPVAVEPPPTIDR